MRILNLLVTTATPYRSQTSKQGTTLPQLALLTVVGILGIGGQSLITHGLTMGEATVLVPLDYSRIIYSAALGYLLFNEIPGPWSFAGMALIVACSLYLVLTEKRRKAE